MKTLKNALQRSSILALGTLLCLTGCSKTEKVDPEANPQMEYSLHNLRYEVSGAGGPDTVTLRLQDTTVLNPTNAQVTRRVASNLSALVKTSYFEVSNLAALPQGVDFEQFQVNLPSDLYSGSSLGYTSFTVPFTTKPAEYPYSIEASDTLTVKVPARSGILVRTSIQAQNIICSFTATLEEKTTGRTYPVKGVWKGLLRYDKVSTVLTELPL